MKGVRKREGSDAREEVREKGREVREEGCYENEVMYCVTAM